MCWLRRLFAALKVRMQPVWERPEAGVSPHSGGIDVAEVPTKKPRKPAKKRVGKKK